MKSSPLHQARELILELTEPEAANEKIHAFEKLSPSERGKELTKYYSTAKDLAATGKTKEISIMLRILDRFGDTSHDRMLLHYIAQAAAAKALKELSTETHPHHHDMVKALRLISEAFTDADKINTERGIK